MSGSPATPHTQIGNVAAGRDVVLQFIQATAAARYKGLIRRFVEEYLSPGTGPGSIPFGGRNDTFALLDEWLCNPAAAPRFVLAAPGGRGKSAVVVHWVDRLRQSTVWYVVFVPISLRAETNEPAVFYQAIAARLADVLREDLRPSAEEPARYYQDRCAELLDTAIERGTPILLVVDGIDEALGESFQPNWFPRNAGPRLRLLVSARLQLDDCDDQGWRRRLGWDWPPGFADGHLLPRLSLEGIRHLLQQSGAPVDVLAARPEIVQKLSALSEGEPLLLRFYVEDLWQPAHHTQQLQVEDLDRLKPGFAGYLKDWLRRQEKAWNKEHPVGFPVERVKAYLAILSCAHGPLDAESLNHLAARAYGHPEPFCLADVLAPVRRFIMGQSQTEDTPDGSYVLTHPKLGDVLREDYFDRPQIRRIQRAYADWGREVLTALEDGTLSPADVPGYLLRYLVYHFESAAAPVKDVMRLVSDGWRRAWYGREGGYLRFASDVSTVWTQLQVGFGSSIQAKFEEQAALPYLVEQVQCALCLSSVRTLGSGTPPALLGRALQEKILTERQVLASLELSLSEGLADDIAAVVHLMSSGSLATLLDLTSKIVSNWARSRALRALAPHLPPEILPRALQAAQQIGEDYSRARALGAIAPRLPPAQQADVLSVTLQVSQQIRDKQLRAEVLAELAPHLPPAQQAVALSAALQTAQRIRNKQLRAEVLAELAPHLPPAQQAVALSAALQTAQQIRNDSVRAIALARVASHLPPVQRADVLSAALQLVPQIEDSGFRAIALHLIAPHLPPELLPAALQMAQQIGDEIMNLLALEALAPRLPPELLPAALQVAQQIGHDSARASALGALAPHLPSVEQAHVLSAALQAAQRIGDSASRASVLVELAPHLPPAQKADVLYAALQVAQQISDDSARAIALGAVAPHLPSVEQADVLSAALQAAQQISHGPSQASALGAIAPHLPSELLPTALQVAQRISGGDDRAQALGALAPHLPPDLLRAALKTAQRIREGDSRGWVLGALAPYLQADERAGVLSAALQAAPRVGNELYRADILIATAPHLPPEMLTAALQTAQQISDKRYSVKAVGALAPYLQADEREGVLSVALQGAPQIGDEESRAWALKALAPHLSPELLPVALKTAQQIGEGDYRGWALAALAPHLPPELLPAALRAAQQIGDDTARANTLSSVVPYLTNDNLPDAVHAWLKTAAKVHRSSVLEQLSSLAPVLARLGPPGTLARIAGSISDVAIWWP